MPHLDADLKNLYNWTDPDSLITARQHKLRAIPLFLRQILPSRLLRTRMTLTGWCLIAISLCLGAAAYNTGENIIFLALSFLLSSLILSGILSLINFKKLDWNFSVPGNLRAGEVGTAEIDLVNKKTVFPSASLCFQLQSEMVAQEGMIYLNKGLNPGESCKLKWSVTPEKRGQHELRISGVQSKFPFGFLERTISSNLKATVIVWPKRVKYTFTAFGRGHQRLTGVTRNKLGQGIDLLNIRPYERGDAPRFIHWKATAQSGQLMIRQLAQEGQSGYHLMMNSMQELWNELQFEQLCSLVGSMAEDLFYSGHLETVKLNETAPLQIRTRHDLRNLFDQLSLLERCDPFTDKFSSPKTNQITFSPVAEGGVAIYLEENYAGQTDIK